MQDNSTTSIRNKAAVAIIATCFVLQALLIYRLNVNWDEYWFLGRIYLADAGELYDPFQNFHVNLFGWLPRLDLAVVEQIVVGRFAMLLFEAVGLACLYWIARKLADHASALVIVVLWFASTYSLAHGASFRTDPLSAALMMSALALMIAQTTSWRSIAAGGLAAISLLVTVKAVFYLPTFGAAFLIVWRREGPKSAAIHFSLAAIATILVGVGLWLWHGSNLAGQVSEAPMLVERGIAASGSAAQKVAGGQVVLARAPTVIEWAVTGFATSILVFAGLLSAAHALMSQNRRARAAVFLLCFLPLLSLIFYRNAYPYFFPFILLPAVLVTLPIVQKLVKSRRLWLEAVLLAAAFGIIGQFSSYWPRDRTAQAAYTSAVQDIFPEPVAYIERSTMLPRFHKSGFFMSSWGIESSAAAGVPGIVEAVSRDQPPLLIASTPALEKALIPEFVHSYPRLTAADEAILRSSYIPHWGALWVAGKRLSKRSGSAELHIAGLYTLECSGTRRINGASQICGSVVQLENGQLEWSGGPVTLRWGDRLHKPTNSPPVGPIYYPL